MPLRVAFDTVDAPFERIEIPATIADEAAVARTELLETLSTALMTIFGTTLKSVRWKKVWSSAASDERLLPLSLCRFSAVRLSRIRRSAIVGCHRRLSSFTIDVPPVEGYRVKGKAVTDELVERAATDDSPLAALAFKITSDNFVGQPSYLRIYSGKMRVGETVERGEGQARAVRVVCSGCNATRAKILPSRCGRHCSCCCLRILQPATRCAAKASSTFSRTWSSQIQ